MSITNHGFNVGDREEGKEEVELMVKIGDRKRGRRNRCWLLVGILHGCLRLAVPQQAPPDNIQASGASEPQVGTGVAR